MSAGQNRRPGSRALRAAASVSAALLVLGVAGAAGSLAAPLRGGDAAVPAEQELVHLERGTEAFVRPTPASREVALVGARRPITGERTVLPVIGQATHNGAGWLDVLLPGRPDSHSGWIPASGTAETFTPWAITVTLDTREVRVYDDGNLVREFKAVVGAASTPTPTGHFFVEETVALSSSYPGAPYALALSARSNTLREFDNGPGQVALHGIANIGGVPGTAASHGCIRLTTAHISWLAARIGPGVPVTITQ
jgi:lipoprotein-anchoring transpeptidase ErfK/SrfK